MNTLEITFGLNDTQFDEDDRSAFATQLLPLLRNDCEAVIQADRSEDFNPESGSKPGFATLIGFLTAEVSLESIKILIDFLGDRLGDKSLKITVTKGNQTVTIEAKSRQELEQLEDIAFRMYQKLN
jgi:hypothetical protein